MWVCLHLCVWVCKYTCFHMCVQVNMPACHMCVPSSACMYIVHVCEYTHLCVSLWCEYTIYACVEYVPECIHACICVCAFVCVPYIFMFVCMYMNVHVCINVYMYTCVSPVCVLVWGVHVHTYVHVSICMQCMQGGCLCVVYTCVIYTHLHTYVYVCTNIHATVQEWYVCVCVMCTCLCCVCVCYVHMCGLPSESWSILILSTPHRAGLSHVFREPLRTDPQNQDRPFWAAAFQPYSCHMPGFVYGWPLKFHMLKDGSQCNGTQLVRILRSGDSEEVICQWRY